jgi:hypothetical protein
MVFLKFNLGRYEFERGTEKLLPILTKGRPGPPEIIGGHEPSGFAACSIKDFGKSKTAIVPFNIGKLYFLHGYEQHKNILLDIIAHLRPALFELVKTDAHERVEVVVKDFRFNTGEKNLEVIDGRIVHFVNITGFSGNTYFEPLTVRNIHANIKMPARPAKVYTLKDKRDLPFEYRGGAVHFMLDKLGEYEAVVMEAGER